MKTRYYFAAFGILLFGWMPSLRAQIRDNESSATALAVQCAMSSGYSVQDYEDYCRRLAKTLGMLSSAQQTRVFGYLPQPGGSASEGETTPATSGSPTTYPVAGGETEGETANGSTRTSESEVRSEDKSGTSQSNSGVGNQGHNSHGNTNSNPGLLVDLVRKINNTLDGTVESSATVVAGATGTNLSGSTNPVTSLTEAAAIGIDNETLSETNGSSETSLLSWLIKKVGL